MNPREAVQSLGSRLYRQVGSATRTVQSIRPLNADLLENETNYLVVVDTPGVESTDLDIRYLDGSISVSIERTRADPVGFEPRFTGRATELTGSVSLPDDAVVDAEAAEARLTDVGTVRIELPKESPSESEETPGEEIPIND